MDVRRKKLLYKAQHCGMKENDVLLGRFAAANLAAMTDSELASFEALLEESDNDLYDWVIGKKSLPDHIDADLMAAIVGFSRIK